MLFFCGSRSTQKLRLEDRGGCGARKRNHRDPRKNGDGGGGRGRSTPGDCSEHFRPRPVPATGVCIYCFLRAAPLRVHVRVPFFRFRPALCALCSVLCALCCSCPCCSVSLLLLSVAISSFTQQPSNPGTTRPPAARRRHLLFKRAC